MQEQQRLAEAMIQHVSVVQKRQEQWKTMVSEFGALGAEANALKARIGELGQPQPDGHSGTVLNQVCQDLHSLAAKAAEVATLARTEDFEELAREAHSLHQRLLSAANKLQLSSSLPDADPASDVN